MKDIIPHFNSEKFLKAMICRSMYSDSRDFLLRAKILKANHYTTDYSWTSKIYVDLVMACESDLKCLIVSLSKDDETPEVAYSTARKKNHDIKKLYEEVEKRAFHRFKLLGEKDKKLLLDLTEKIKVNNRYKLMSMFKKYDGASRFSKSFSDNYFFKLITIATELHSIAEISIQKFTPPLLMDGNVEEYFERIKKFEEDVPKL